MVNPLPNFFNGLQGWVDPRRQALLGLASGLVSQPNLGDALGVGFQRAAEGRQQDTAYATAKKEEATRQAQLNATIQAMQKAGRQDLVDAVNGGLPLADAWSAFLRKDTVPGQTADIQNYEYGLSHPGFTDYQTQKGGAAETSLTPTWGVDANGNPVIGQLNKAGVFVPTQLPEGVKAMDPRTLAGERQGGTTLGKERATAAATLPGLEQNVNIAIDALKRIRENRQGLNEHFSQIGALPRDIYIAPGSALGNLKSDLDQALGQSFMQAREGLKGGGPITDFEGQKAEAAYTRMRKAYDQGDAQTFAKALDEFEFYIKQGYAKMKAFAEGTYEAPASPGGSDPFEKYGLER